MIILFPTQAFPKDVHVRENEQLNFSYDLFGTQISSKPFTWPLIGQFQSERATAKICTTPEKLKKFFLQKMSTFCIFVTAGGSGSTSSKYLSLAEVNLSKVLPIDLEEIAKGKLSHYEGVLPLEAVKVDPEEDTAKSFKSESALVQPHVGVRFSVGLYPDAGLQIINGKPSDETDLEKLKQENVEASQKLWMPLASKPEVAAVASSPGSAKKSLDFTNLHDSISSIVMEPLKNPKGKSFKNDESIQRFKFIANLKKIKLNHSDKGIDCVLKYKYKPFCSTEVSTAPSFFLEPFKEHEIKRGYCEYNFSAKESAVKKPLEKHPLHIGVFDQGQHLGTASVQLAKLFTSEATRTLDSRSCLIQVPILHRNELGSADILGSIECLFVLKEMPMTSTLEQTLPVSSSSAFEKVSPDKSMENMEKAALELEEWKHKQRDKFKQQLQGLESHHINVLTQEWEKREKERENLIHEKLNEIFAMEKELKRAIEDNKSREKVLKIREEELSERERKLTERESKMSALNDRKRPLSLGADGKQSEQKVKDLTRENEKLRQEVKTKQDNISILNRELVPLKKEVATLRSQNLELQKTKTANLEQISTLEKAKDFYQKAFEEADQFVKKLQSEKELNNQQRMENVANENAQLKSDLERYRNMYENKLLKLVSMSRTELLPMETEEFDNSSSLTPPTSVENNSRSQKSEILRLKKERELLLNTKVYNENDPIVKMLDAKISDLLKK